MMTRLKFYYFISAIDNETCDKIIKIGIDKINKDKCEGINTQATVGGELDKKTNPSFIPKNELTASELKQKNIKITETYVRDSEVSWLDLKWLYELIQKYMLRANIEAGWNFDIDYSETPQFTVYNKLGFYSWHTDGEGDWNSVYKLYIRGHTDEKLRKDGELPNNYTFNKNLIGKVRKLSFTLNLTDPNSYEGGNLMFDLGSHSEKELYECVEARPRGSIIVFPSFLQHCVTPIKKGIRYSLVNWMVGRPFK